MADQGNPFAPVFMNPNASRTGLWDLRMMSAANRSETPFMRGSRGMYSHQGIGGDPMIGGLAAMANEPDYSQFTYDPAMRARAVAAGVQPLEASQVKQNSILPNSGFFGNHPMLSRAIEGGIFGGLAAHGGETAGESFQGALEGLVGGQRIQRGLFNQQFARPFEAASLQEGLDDRVAQRQLRQAQIKRYQDESDIQRDRAETERMKAGIGLDRINATRPVPVEGGTYVYNNQGSGAPKIGPDGLLQPSTPPGWTFEAGPGRPVTNSNRDLSTGLKEQLRIMGVDPAKASSEDLAVANDRLVHQKSVIAGGTTAARQGAEEPYKNLDQARKDHSAKIKSYEAQQRKATDPATRQKYLQSFQEEYYNNWTSSAMAAAASGKKAPPFAPPGENELNGLLKNYNDSIQAQIDAENNNFSQNYPQALETPRANKSPRQSTGSSSKRIPTYNQATGRVE